jgi:hypothetical protein
MNSSTLTSRCSPISAMVVLSACSSRTSCVLADPAPAMGLMTSGRPIESAAARIAAAPVVVVCRGMRRPAASSARFIFSLSRNS